MGSGAQEQGKARLAGWVAGVGDLATGRAGLRCLELGHSSMGPSEALEHGKQGSAVVFSAWLLGKGQWKITRGRP